MIQNWSTIVNKYTWIRIKNSHFNGTNLFLLRRTHFTIFHFIAEIKKHWNVRVLSVMMCQKTRRIRWTNRLVACEAQNHILRMIHPEMIDCIWTICKCFIAMRKCAFSFHWKSPICYLATSFQSYQIMICSNWLAMMRLLRLISKNRKQISDRIWMWIQSLIIPFHSFVTWIRMVWVHFDVYSGNELWNYLDWGLTVYHIRHKKLPFQNVLFCNERLPLIEYQIVLNNF